jgi:cyclomaltodextrinase
VSRVASLLHEPAHLYPLYALLFTMPGVPSIYYGSEWGLQGDKSHGDTALRPGLCLPGDAIHAPHPELARAIGRFAAIRGATPALRRGDYAQLFVAHEQLAFARRSAENVAVVALNAAAEPAALDLAPDLPDGSHLVDRLDPAFEAAVHGGRLRVNVPPRWARILVRG